MIMRTFGSSLNNKIMAKLAEQLVLDANLSVEQANKSVEIITTYLKSKFPKALHEEIETVMKDGNFGDAFKGNLKDLIGKAEETAKEVAHKADEVLTEMGDKLRDIFKKKT